MYLYFDRTGKLKEVINDEALRQGNYEVNKMYIYIDREDVNSIDAEYLLASGLIVGPGNYTTRKQEEIPFNQKRDIYWFKYHTTYNFFVVNLETDLNGNSPLDEAGLVHCNMEMNLEGGGVYALGEVNFNVEVNSVLNQNQVATQEYMSLSDYLFLRTSMVPYSGATDDVNVGQHKVTAKDFYIRDTGGNGGQGFIGFAENNLHIDTGTGSLCLTADDNVYVGNPVEGNEIATKKDLPKKETIATFNTNNFVTDGETKRIYIILGEHFIPNSDLLIITWGGCFAICPIAQGDTICRVCAALWNADGEAQITRIRYQISQVGELGYVLAIWLPASFQLPSNFTGYVINYKIA